MGGQRAGRAGLCPPSAPELCHGTGGTACCWDKGIGVCCPQIPGLSRRGAALPCLGRGRAALTQMTRFGEPMLEPGGEMEVSDVLLCCGGTKGEGR